MSNLSVFSFQSKSVRTWIDGSGNIWFCLIDVLAAIGSRTEPSYAQDSVIEIFGDGVSIKRPLGDALGREQETTFISEGATTFLISRSRTEAGKQMNRWMHNDVLPSIRKTGSYSIAPNLSSKQIAYIERRQQARELKTSELDRLHNEASMFLKLLATLERYDSTDRLVLAIDEWGRRNSESFRKYHRLYIKPCRTDRKGTIHSSPACNANKIARLYGYQSKSRQQTDGTRCYHLTPPTDIVKT